MPNYDIQIIAYHRMGCNPIFHFFLARPSRLLPLAALGLMTLIGAGGYVQVATAPVFWCGLTEAFPGTTILAVVCIGHAGLFLAAGASPRWARPYRLAQFAALPFVLAGLCQIFISHPGSALLLVTLAMVPCLLLRVRPHFIGLSTVSALGFLAAFGQIPFTLPGVIVTHWMLGASILAGVAASAAVVHFARTIETTAPILPLTLLLFPILRAKLPDIAYDSLSYKTTLPYQLAQWLTGDTAIPDGYMVGTNLQEMLNALLVAITGDYLPPFISTIAYVLLVAITPLAFPGRGLIPALAALSAFTLTEAAIAQGTAYQEPLMLLFLVAAMIRCPAWPAFLAMAIAVKINAAFIAPLLVLYHGPPKRLLVGALAAAIVLAPQLNRNVIFSGRLLGMQETLAAFTDPPGPRQVMAAGGTRYDTRPRGGIVNNAIQSACNMWLLDGLCPVTYAGTTEAGFNVFPASRAPLFALVFAAAVLFTRRRIALASAAAYGIGYVGFLAFLSEDRYFLPLSFGFSILLMLNREQAEAAVNAIGRRPAIALGCFLAGSNLIPGTFTNASWICKREVTTPAVLRDLRGPETRLQTFLASTVDRYTQACPPPGLPPVILAENDRLNSPYLGTQRIFHVFTQPMIARFFAADPTRQASAADAILTLVYETPAYPTDMLGSARKDFAACFEADGLHVLCSTHLAPTGTQCARSLY